MKPPTQTATTMKWIHWRTTWSGRPPAWPPVARTSIAKAAASPAPASQSPPPRNPAIVATTATTTHTMMRRRKGSPASDLAIVPIPAPTERASATNIRPAPTSAVTPASGSSTRRPGTSPANAPMPTTAAPKIRMRPT